MIFKSKYHQKKFKQIVLKSLSKNNNIVSATIVGSLNSNKKEIGDIDIVLISKTINKNYINKVNKTIKQIELNKYFSNPNYKILINNSFGPIKYDFKKYVIFHLMYYDIEAHKNHVIESPFTCYDWERSKNYIGKSLKEIYPVGKIYLEDFLKSRRSISEYIKILNSQSIVQKIYSFNKKIYKIKRKKIKLNKTQLIEVCHHIIKFLTINLIKYEYQKNINPNKETIKNYIKKINKENLKTYNNLENFRKSKNIYLLDVIKFTRNYLKNFNSYIRNINNNSKNIYFFRHANTGVKNKFIGSRSDIDIVEKKYKIPVKINPDLVFSSKLKRSIQTAKMFYKKIKSNKLLDEMDYGACDGMIINQALKKFSYLEKSWKNKKDPKFPNGENFENVKKRVSIFLKKLKKMNFKNSYVFTHNNIIKALFCNLTGLKINNYHLIKINFLNYIHIRFYNNKFNLSVSRKIYYKCF